MYEEYLRKGITNDSDFMTYSDPKGLIALKNRVQQINNVGVFIKNQFSLKNVRINLKFLEDEQKKIVTYYILKRLIEVFQKAGYRKQVAHYVVIDESSFFLDIHTQNRASASQDYPGMQEVRPRDHPIYTESHAVQRGYFIKFGHEDCLYGGADPLQECCQGLRY